MIVAAHTLGCKLNYAETSDMLRRLAEDGNEVVDFGMVADIYIINTCTVTAVAEKNVVMPFARPLHKIQEHK